MSPILDDAGKVVGVSSIARDITERASTALLASLVNSSDDAIDSKTLDGTITSWNPAAEQMYGYSANEIIGKNISMLSHPDRPEEMDEILQRIRNGERVEHYETVRVRKDGRRISISLSVSPILDDAGKVVGVSSIARDVTERTGATKTLLASIVNSSDDAIDSKTLDGIITSWNPAAERMYGYSADEILGKNISMLSHPDRPEEMDEILEQIRNGERVEHYETVRVRKDGRTISISLTVSPILDDTGKIVGVSSIARDITERKRADEQLRAASQYARSLIEASLDPLVTISPEGKITDVNEATIKVTGVPREQLIGTDFSDYFTEPEKAREGYQQVFCDGLRHRLPADHPPQGRAAHRRALQRLGVQGRPRNVLGVFAAARDVTAQKQASQYARSLIEASLDPLVTISPEGKITDVNEATDQGHRRRRARSSSAPTSPTTSPSRRRRAKATSRSSRRASSPTIRSPSVTSDGRLTDVLYNASVYKDARGNVLGVFAAARDVTAQKQASQYARSLIEACLDPLVTISPEGKITDVNEATAQVTGVPRERLIGTDFSDYFTEPEKAREGYQQVFEKGAVTDYPLTIRHQNGKLTDVLYNASVYKDARGNVLGVFAAARDVTAQKQASQYARSLIEACLDPLVTISPEGKITDVNEATIKVTGVSRERLIGTDFSDYFTEPEKAREGYQQVFAKGFVTDYPLTIRHRDGQPHRRPLQRLGLQGRARQRARRVRRRARRHRAEEGRGRGRRAAHQGARAPRRAGALPEAHRRARAQDDRAEEGDRGAPRVSPAGAARALMPLPRHRMAARLDRALRRLRPAPSSTSSRTSAPRRRPARRHAEGDLEHPRGLRGRRQAGHAARGRHPRPD